MKFPEHIAVIMDGNGRWAKKRLLPRSAGHRAGMNRMIALSEHAFDRGVKYFTLYALSTENLNRPAEELDGLMKLFREYFAENAEMLRKKHITLRVIGDLSLLPADVSAIIGDGVRRTAGGERGVLTLAIGYGARQEIVAAVNRAVRAGKEVSEADFADMLSTAGVPDPDLLIRTGKEKRLSNFLLWQCSYTELYFTDRLFPDFSDGDLDAAIEDYARRDRRYGRTE